MNYAPDTTRRIFHITIGKQTHNARHKDKHGVGYMVRCHDLKHMFNCIYLPITKYAQLLASF